VVSLAVRATAGAAGLLPQVLFLAGRRARSRPWPRSRTCRRYGRMTCATVWRPSWVNRAKLTCCWPGLTRSCDRPGHPGW